MLSVLAQEAADRYHRRGWHRMAELATPMGVTAAGAAACDVVENTTLLALVNGSPSRTLPRVARQAALTKFGLLGAVVTYLLGGVLFGKPAHH